MSNVITSQCWPLRMPPTAKAVLISLADQASDSGQCWPSITTICERTCFGRTAVIDAIAWLEEAGALTANRANGRHTTYCVTPEKYAEPVREANQYAKQTGPADVREPVRLADNQSGRRTAPVRQADTNHKEPPVKATIKEPSRDAVAELLADIPADLLADFKQIRKAKKAPLTATAVKGLIRECGKAGLTLQAGIEMCCERGWSAIKAEWLAKPVNGQPATQTRVRPLL